MEIEEFEGLMRNQIAGVVSNIVKENPRLNISAKSRAGAEISSWLEKAFVESSKGHEFLTKSESSPVGKTKHPWDARTFVQINGHTEEVWIDFKAFKISGKDSNPDIGTPNKVIKFIEAGGFYLLYVHIYYKESEEGLEFVQKDGDLVKSYFLKDISNSVRLTPTNQLQVNIDAKPSYRTRSDFVELLVQKMEEGLNRRLASTKKKLASLANQRTSLADCNKKSEAAILEKLQ